MFTNKDITLPDEEIKKITKAFSDNKYKAIFNSLLWVKNNLEVIDFDKDKFRKRDASEIVKSRKFMGCTDVAIVFLSFMRALGIKANYLETISERTITDFIKYPNRNFSISGHIFVRVFLDDISMIVDPTSLQILLRNNLPAHSMFPDAIQIAEGKDFIELDIDSEEKIRQHTKAFIKNTIV